MEPESIDWSTIETTFEEDYTYENINAPKWVDLSAPTESDETWFCNPNCEHHMKVEDSLKPTRDLKMKVLRSMSISGILPFRRGDVKQKENKLSEDNDNENQNPNHYFKAGKEKKKQSLRSTFSARNLVGRGEVITGFCGELKKLARNGLKKGSTEKDKC